MTTSWQSPCAPRQVDVSTMILSLRGQPYIRCGPAIRHGTRVFFPRQETVVVVQTDHNGTQRDRFRKNSCQMNMYQLYDHAIQIFVQTQDGIYLEGPVAIK